MKTDNILNRFRSHWLTGSFPSFNRFQEEREVIMKIKKIKKTSTGLCKCKRSC